MMTFPIDGKTHVPNHQPDNKGFLQIVAFIQVWNSNWFCSTVRTRKTHRLIRLDIRYMCQQWITMEIWLKDVERNLFIPVFNRKSYTPGVGLFNLRLGLKGPRTDSPKFFWLVVYLPLWKIWKSVGSNYCSQHMEKKQTANQCLLLFSTSITINCCKSHSTSQINNSLSGDQNAW